MKGTEKTKIVSSQNVLESGRISSLLRETQTRLAETQAALDRLPEERRTILGATEVDHKALESLDERKTALAVDLDDVQTRIRLLTEQHAEAQKAEAGIRLRDIAQEVTTLRADLGTATAALENAGEALLAAARRVTALHCAHRELQLETAALIRTFRFPTAQVQTLQQPTFYADFLPHLGAAFDPIREGLLSTTWPRKKAA
jgi:predicted  nucleic acid-binding Zn-ribbon protein